MLKKITALLLITAFTHAYAITPGVQGSIGFDRSLDELNYKLNVQWDQKDSDFFEKTMKEFEKNIVSLQKEGLQNSDLIALSLEKIKDKQIQSQVADLARTIDENQMTNDEAKSFVLEKLAATYAKGASWSGHRMGHRAAVIVGLIVILLCVCKDHHDRNPTHGDHRPNPCDNHEMPNSYDGPSREVCLI